jgi:hypothetical protein
MLSALLGGCSVFGALGVVLGLMTLRRLPRHRNAARTDDSRWHEYEVNMRRYMWLLAVTLVSTGRDGALTSQTLRREPPVQIFATLGLTPEQSSAVDAGRPVAKVLSWGSPSEVYVFGAVHVDAPSEIYLKAVRDVARLTTAPGYLGVGELRDDATVTDLNALALDPDDVKALETCREGSCDVQLPVATIEAFRHRVDWSRSDAAEQVNGLARPMVLQLLRAYQQGGNQALGEYRDKQHPARIADQLETMVQRASALPEVFPELRRYLLEFPNAALPHADSYFYWEKVDFGLKPTIRLNHAVMYRGRAQGREFATVAIKQLYATHYFRTALDVSVCVQDGAADHPGFYLLTLKGSRQEGLTGIRGSLVRKAVVHKARTCSNTRSALSSDWSNSRQPAADVHDVRVGLCLAASTWRTLGGFARSNTSRPTARCARCRRCL